MTSGVGAGDALRAGYEALDAGDRTGALRLFEGAARIDPNNLEAHLLCAQVLARSGKLVKARKSYLEAIRIAPENARLRAEYAEFLGSPRGRTTFIGAMAECERQLSEALSLAPDDPFVLQGAFSLRMEAFRYKEAREILSAYVRVGGDSAFVNNALGDLALEASRDYGAAYRAFAATLLADPANPYANFKIRRITARANPLLWPASLDRFSGLIFVLLAAIPAFVAKFHYPKLDDAPPLLTVLVFLGFACIVWYFLATSYVDKKTSAELKKMGVDPR